LISAISRSTRRNSSGVVLDEHIPIDREARSLPQLSRRRIAAERALS